MLREEEKRINIHSSVIASLGLALPPSFFLRGEHNPTSTAALLLLTISISSLTLTLTLSLYTTISLYLSLSLLFLFFSLSTTPNIRYQVHQLSP